MQQYVIRRPSAWASMEELAKAGAKSGMVIKEHMGGQVRWIRTYAVQEPDGRIGTFCIYEAASGEAIRQHARLVGMPGEEFYPVMSTIVIEKDPMTTMAA